MLLKPYYERNQTRLYCGDMLEVLPPVQADLLLTDPPYARAGGVHTGRSSMAGRGEDIAGADQFWLHWFKAVVSVMVSRTKAEGCGFIFCDYRTVHLVEDAYAATGSGWAVTQCLVWDRDSIGLGSPFRASHELIAFARGPKFQWKGSKSIGNVLRFRWPYGAHEHHPAEKPVSLLRFLIETASEPNDLILDPFAGSGSTMVAAQQVDGRAVVGVEASDAYCEIAARRLSQGVLPLAAAV
jgi:site-specific DNA-methyltransferase (adenine-specific)